jgi:mRNA degradation ribonuclease J1/J2
MHMKVLGCHGSDQLIDGEAGVVQHESCGFLIDDAVLLDAGTIGTRLTLHEQRRIRVVLLSHLHFDHIKSLPTLVDNLAHSFDESLMVMATETVLQGLREHVFNDKVYPNFFKLPNPQRPVLKGQILDSGKWVNVHHLEVMPIAVNHSVPTVGYIIKGPRAALLYSGDTYETEEIWAQARAVTDLKAALIESSFPNELSAMARQAKHLTPALLSKEWTKLHNSQVQVYAYHLKPPFHEVIAGQLDALLIPHLSILKEGQELNL